MHGPQGQVSQGFEAMLIPFHFIFRNCIFNFPPPPPLSVVYSMFMPLLLHVCVCGPKGSGFHLCCLLPYSFEAGSLEAFYLGWQTTTPVIPLSPILEYLCHNCGQHHGQLVMWVLGSKFWPSYLCGKCFQPWSHLSSRNSIAFGFKGNQKGQNTFLPLPYQNVTGEINNRN